MIMFCKRVDYALVLMLALAQRQDGEEKTIQEIARLHNFSSVNFKWVAEQLEKSGFITRKADDKLMLNLSPKEITIWQIVTCASKEEALKYGAQSHQKRSSIVAMINKEDEFLQEIIRSRLKRYKLSTWSEKASNTIYI